VHAFDMSFQMIFPQKGLVTFWTLNFMRHLTMHSSQVPLKITFIVIKRCTKVTRKLDSSFNSVQSYLLGAKHNWMLKAANCGI